MMLIIWEEIPESCKAFLVDVKSKQARWARKASNKFINADELDSEHEIFKLSDWLETKEGKATRVEFPIKECEVTQVVRCGFAL